LIGQELSPRARTLEASGQHEVYGRQELSGRENLSTGVNIPVHPIGQKLSTLSHTSDLSNRRERSDRQKLSSAAPRKELIPGDGISSTSSTFLPHSSLYTKYKLCDDTLFFPGCCAEHDRLFTPNLNCAVVNKSKGRKDSGLGEMVALPLRGNEADVVSPCYTDCDSRNAIHQNVGSVVVALVGLLKVCLQYSNNILTSDRPKTFSAEYSAEKYRPNIRPKQIFGKCCRKRKKFCSVTFYF
jgi:hypothetical protein